MTQDLQGNPLATELNVSRALSAWQPLWCVGDPAARETILDQLWITLRPSVHEHQISSYGVLFVPDATAINLGDAREHVTPLQLTELSDAQVKIARQSADGYRSWLLWEGSVFRGILNAHGAQFPELITAGLVVRTDGVLIVRDRQGMVRLVSRKTELRHSHRSWTRHASLEEADALIRAAVPLRDTLVLQELLKLSMHLLSPRGIGATLILDVRDAATAPNGELSVGAAGTDCFTLELGVQDGRSMARLLHVLAQNDGACLLNSRGGVTDVGVHLAIPPAAREIIPPSPGTRHTSARCASFASRDHLFLVVSADGGISAFWRGANLLAISWRAKGDVALEPHSAGPSGAQVVVGSCARCCSALRHEYLEAANGYGSRDAECPVCGHLLAGVVPLDSFIRSYPT